ncbi:SsgA family sporulation/cell division regulator [Nocardioides sp.]|uniref:SsgA family sporulation/cell division regulator n=1 Tax=Nocardioides sp. TaxID=35761 RepID=UPI00271F5E08|nr:SsgA family sporulation/cell division regulator [Nocardioides sp.]MDO9457508.1 SsgA family sporulation/cell division regulator [Nocardioides sp.]
MTQQPLAPAVTADIALHCDDELGRPMAFIATFSYDALDPYAVRVTFHVPAGDIPWVVARSLLTRGLGEPVGEGDIRLRPGLDEDGRAVVRMDFHSPEGRLQVEVRTADLLAFLGRTWLAVHPGDERVNVDALLDALLA